jgi:gag-polyprotein putative aspartyl protease
MGKALWDTGATHTCISDRLAAQMGLAIVDIVQVATANGIVRVPTYFAQIKLSNGLIISDLELDQFQFSNDECDLIVGMDIITQGDFSITNVGGKTVFSFRIPTLSTIDYEAALTN